ncbi:ubiquitin carboxyl-terminal hydrolase 30 isoform X2 [Bacillus rossius redtenbacheri]|uniref:ubiquitin carboxyl-terminal hydrolase 30 isoform X2 n=1 Tax=Bacillus rossius redtenbacheri TaxID=93214 RepID=UPI002FDD5EBC
MMLQENLVTLACAVVAVSIGIFIVWGPDVYTPKKRKVLSGRMASDEDVLVPSRIISSLESRGWALSPGQQDAHELFHNFLTTLEEETQQLSSKKLSLVNILEASEEEAVAVSPQLRRRMCHEPSKLAVSPFQGLLTNQLQCVHCGHKTSLRYDKFDSLSLNLLEQSSLQSQTLPHLLAKFVSTEMVMGVACEGCDVPTATAVAFKTLRLGKLPSCLCLHISRTTWQDSGQAFKRLDYVEFPEMLNMNPYIFSSSAKAVNSSDNSTKLEKDDVLPSPDHIRLNHMYQLVSVVVHSGSATSGHFITYRLSHGTRTSWWFTSDTEVRRCSLPEVMKSCAYMLFYVKCSSLQ